LVFRVSGEVHQKTAIPFSDGDSPKILAQTTHGGRMLRAPKPQRHSPKTIRKKKVPLNAM